MEAIEIPLNDFHETNKYFRIDAEFFKKEFVTKEKKLLAQEHKSLAQVAKVTDGEHGSPDLDHKSNILYLSGHNVNDNVLSLDDIRYCSKTLHDKNKRSAIELNSVLLSIVGTVGNASVIYKNIIGNTDRNVASIKKIDKLFSPYFVSTFLNSKYGKFQTERQSTGNVQPLLNLIQVNSLIIPIVSKTIQQRIEDIVKESHRQLDVSRSLYFQTEQTLLRALGLENWHPPEPLTYTRRASDAFAAERFDAEYFYPSKQAALDFLSALPGKSVGEMFISVRDLWQPETANPSALLRNYDLTEALSPFLDDTKPPTLPDTISSTKKRIAKGDIVVSRLRSYLKEIAVVLDGGELPMVCSTEFVVLRPKHHSMRIESLLVYLRSTLPQLIFKWSQDGSNHPRFDEKELLNLRVPDMILEHEDEIVEQVQSAIAATRQARVLLDAAKRAVEIAIEHNEQAAFEYLATFNKEER